MGQLEDLHLFVTIVDSNGIARAADRLHIAKSAVSRRLGLVEERYGVQLIDRQRGTWKVTAAGHELYERAARLVAEGNELASDFKHTSHSLAGPLSVSVADEFGLTCLKPHLVSFANQHPKIQLTVDFENRHVDLLRENYDIAIRISESVDPGLVEQRLGSSTHRLFASKQYAQQHQLPRSLQELAEHPLLHHGSARRAHWSFLTAAKPQSIEFVPALNSNSGPFLLQATLQGLGIARLPDFLARDAFANGSLVQVLPDSTIGDWRISLVYSSTNVVTNRMLAFIETMKSACAEL